MAAIRVPKVMLTFTISILVLSLFFSFYILIGPGTLQADFYYLPLREHVEEDQQLAMEEKVIQLWNAEHRRGAKLSIARDGLLLVTLLGVRLVLTRTQSAAS